MEHSSTRLYITSFVLLSTPLPACTSPHLLNVLIQIANKLGFQKKILVTENKPIYNQSIQFDLHLEKGRSCAFLLPLSLNYLLFF
jgi:hypothetical protein